MKLLVTPKGRMDISLRTEGKDQNGNWKDAALYMEIFKPISSGKSVVNGKEKEVPYFIQTDKEKNKVNKNSKIIKFNTKEVAIMNYLLNSFVETAKDTDPVSAAERTRELAKQIVGSENGLFYHTNSKGEKTQVGIFFNTWTPKDSTQKLWRVEFISTPGEKIEDKAKKEAATYRVGISNLGDVAEIRDAIQSASYLLQESRLRPSIVETLKNHNVATEVTTSPKIEEAKAKLTANVPEVTEEDIDMPIEDTYDDAPTP